MGCGPSSVVGAKTVEFDGFVAKPRESRLQAASRDRSSSSDSLQLHSVISIQKWFRRKRAYFERQRLAAWHIFQRIEYKGEEEQVRLAGFFAAAVKHSTTLQALISPKQEAVPLPAMGVAQELAAALRSNPLPTLTMDGARALLKDCEAGQFPPWQQCLSILAATYDRLRSLPNVTRISTATTKKLCVVGDLHGQFGDLLVILDKNGLPSDSNPYLFNGDLVDRGTCGLEVCMAIFYFFLLSPGSVHINRGNHEDYLMNKRYGFEKEVLLKYGTHGGLLMRAFSAVFTLLPLASVVNSAVLVVHAGLTYNFSLSNLDAIPRGAYPSVLALAQSANAPDSAVTADERMLVALMWNDPGSSTGVVHNERRGGGGRWGPDITASVLAREKLTVVIRSHECMLDGHAATHFGKVMTVFSASNYYSQSSNYGAYVKITDEATLSVVQFICTRHTQVAPRSLRERVSAVERAALRELGEEMVKAREQILQACEKRDPRKTGELGLAEWAAAMAEGCPIEGVPWRSIAPRFVKISRTGRVSYHSCLDRFSVQCRVSTSSAGPDVRLLYRNLPQLEYVFRLLDRDQSGSLSLDEFRQAYRALREYDPSMLGIPDESAEAFLSAMDLDRNGRVDFNEFVESFRLVHTAVRAVSEGMKS